MRASVKEVHCVGTTKGCSLNSPPLDYTGPAAGMEELRWLHSSGWQVYNAATSWNHRGWRKAHEHIVCCCCYQIWKGASSDFCCFQPSAARLHSDDDLQHPPREAEKRKSMTTVKPWPIFNWGTWFTVSHGVLRLQSPLQLLWFFIHPRPPLHRPRIQLMEAPLSMSTQATTSKGVMLGVNAEWLKTKLNWKVKKSPRGRGTFTAAPWRGKKKEKSYYVPWKEERGN